MTVGKFVHGWWCQWLSRKIHVKVGAKLSVADAITIMIAFGALVLDVVNVVVAIITAIWTKKDRH